MRSYDQYCAVAKSLDVIGDRWNLLIARELIMRGPSRYTDLQHGLPGIATNLLADRLRNLEEAGVVRREEAPPPIATTLFHLTEWGEQLRPVLVELVRWGIPLMVAGPARDDAFRSYWLGVVAELFPTDREPDGEPVAIELRFEDEPVTIEVSDGRVLSRAGPADNPDLVVTGPAQVMLGVMAGRLALAEARELGLEVEGDPAVLLRLRPEATTETAPQPTH